MSSGWTNTGAGNGREVCGRCSEDDVHSGVCEPFRPLFESIGGSPNLSRYKSISEKTYDRSRRGTRSNSFRKLT